MRVAVPIFGTRVSPRFDCGQTFLVVEVSDGKVGSAERVSDGATNALQQIRWLRELGVDVVVCGAITCFRLRHLAANGIQVFPWVFSEAGEALAALARGELTDTAPPRGRCRYGRGHPGGASVGTCVCPNCGKQAPHQRDVPCATAQCSACGTWMARQH